MTLSREQEIRWLRSQARANAEAKYKRKRGQICRKNVGAKIERFIDEVTFGLRATHSRQVVYLEKPRWGCVLYGVTP